MNTQLGIGLIAVYDIALRIDDRRACQIIDLYIIQGTGGPVREGKLVVMADNLASEPIGHRTRIIPVTVVEETPLVIDGPVIIQPCEFGIATPTETTA